jgi:uncharacterized protein
MAETCRSIVSSFPMKHGNLITELEGSKRMHYLLLYDVVEDYATKRTPFRAAHLEHLKKAYDRGEVLLAGALSEPSDGAVLVFSGSKPGSAEEFAKIDPYVLNGLITAWKVRKWMTVIGEGTTQS